MEEQIESGQWPAEPQRVPPTPPPIPARPLKQDENKSSAPSTKPIEEEKFEVFSSPAPEIGLRTLESDKESIKSGEVRPEAESVLPSELKEVFEQPETISQLEEPIKEVPVKNKKILQILLLIAGILVVGAGLGVFGYYVIYPLVFPPPPTEGALTESETIIESAPVLHHQSFFAELMPKDKISFSISLISPSVINKAYQDIEKENGLKEIEIQDEKNNQIAFIDFISQFLPLVTTDKTKFSQLFEADFTAVIYYDKDGAIWPNYIAKLKPQSSVVLANSVVAQIEGFDEIKNFFVSDPGTPSISIFKDGLTNSYPARYLPFSQKGASFNYVWLDNYLLISTNYSAAQEIAVKLGFPKK